MLIPSMLALAAIVTGDSPRERDLRCIAALSYATAQADAEKRSGMIAGFMYYLGKLDARDPGIDLKVELPRLLVDEAAFAKALPDEFKRCGGELESRGATLKDLGATLMRQGQPAK